MTKAAKAMLSARADAVSTVNDALQAIGKKLWRVSEIDGLRLIRLLVWSEKYAVSVQYILEAVLPALSRAVEYRTGKKSRGLGISIGVLTGKVAKEILLEKIKKDFPGGENAYAVREERRNDMLEKLDSDMNGKPRNPLQYKTAEGFTTAYEKTIVRKRSERDKLEEQIAAMPFRSNPFR